MLVYVISKLITRQSCKYLYGNATIILMVIKLQRIKNNIWSPLQCTSQRVSLISTSCNALKYHYNVTLWYSEITAIARNHFIKQFVWSVVRAYCAATLLIYVYFCGPLRSMLSRRNSIMFHRVQIWSGYLNKNWINTNWIADTTLSTIPLLGDRCKNNNYQNIRNQTYHELQELYNTAKNSSFYLILFSNYERNESNRSKKVYH